MSKRLRHLEAREQEKRAVRMRLRGATLRAIYRSTTVPTWMVDGLVMAAQLRLGLQSRSAR
jgi:hypothetical protein